MKCTMCENEKPLKKERITVKYKDCGLDNVTLIGVTYYKCHQCGEEDQGCRHHADHHGRRREMADALLLVVSRHAPRRFRRPDQGRGGRGRQAPLGAGGVRTAALRRLPLAELHKKLGAEEVSIEVDLNLGTASAKACAPAASAYRTSPKNWSVRPSVACMSGAASASEDTRASSSARALPPISTISGSGCAAKVFQASQANAIRTSALVIPHR